MGLADIKASSFIPFCEKSTNKKPTTNRPKEEHQSIRQYYRITNVYSSKKIARSFVHIKTESDWNRVAC